MWKKMRNFCSFLVAAVLSVTAFASVALAAYPDRPITVIANHTPGSGSDLGVRALAEHAAKTLGQPIVITNKPGGGGMEALVALAVAKPDGYTIGTTSESILGSKPHVLDFPFDPLKAYDHVMGYGRFQFGPCVKGDSPFKTLKDLVNYAKANPSRIKYGVSGVASPNNYFMVYLAKMEGIKWEAVVFKGIVEAATAVMGGHIDVVASTSGIAAPYVQGGRLRPLASASEARWKIAPNVPTLKELGYNIQLDSTFGISAPRGVPKPNMDKLRNAFKKALDDPEFSKIMARINIDIVYRSGDEYQAIIEAVYKDSEKMLKGLGLHKSQKK